MSNGILRSILEYITWIAAIIFLIGGLFLILGPYLPESFMHTSVNIMNMIQIETDNERIGAGIICIAVFAVLVVIWKYIIKTED